MFELNLFAAARMAQAVIPGMRKQGQGTIVNIGSVGGFVSLPWAVMYCASKFALHAYSDSLRRELRGSGLRVLKVCPGIVNTEFRDHVLGGSAPDDVKNIDRLVSAQQVAESLVRGVERNARSVYVPWVGRVFTALEFVSPSVMDWYLARKWKPDQSGVAASPRLDVESHHSSLRAPGGDPIPGRGVARGA
jgi:short-subunit dehydrogenase